MFLISIFSLSSPSSRKSINQLLMLTMNSKILNSIHTPQNRSAEHGCWDTVADKIPLVPSARIEPQVGVKHRLSNVVTRGAGPQSLASERPQSDEYWILNKGAYWPRLITNRREQLPGDAFTASKGQWNDLNYRYNRC